MNEATEPQVTSEPSGQNERDRVALLQYKSLRENFSKLIRKVLGPDYYNMGMDVYECDRICCEDVGNKVPRCGGNHRATSGRILEQAGNITMAIQDESEIDDAFERIEELAFEHLSLKEAVEEKRKELEEAENELSDFEENYPEAL